MNTANKAIERAGNAVSEVIETTTNYVAKKADAAAGSVAKGAENYAGKVRKIVRRLSPEPTSPANPLPLHRKGAVDSADIARSGEQVNRPERSVDIIQTDVCEPLQPGNNDVGEKQIQEAALLNRQEATRTAPSPIDCSP